MTETIATSIILCGSALLFAFWFRTACLLILVAKPTRDYARGIATANQLAFQEVQETLGDETEVDLRKVRDALDRDLRVLSFLLKHPAPKRDDGIEWRMLRINYWTMAAWCSVIWRVSPKAARRGLKEM